MAAVACGKRNLNLCNVFRSCRNLYLNHPTIKSQCNCGTLNRYVRFNSDLCNKNNSRSRILQNYHWFNRKSSQIVNYYVKEKNTGQSNKKLLWGAICAVTGGFLVGGVVNLGQPDEEIADLYSNEPVILGYIYRFRDRLHEVKESYEEPSSDLLLPDPLPEPYIQPKYTLVIELTDVLVHPEYSRSSGWRFRKRPGITPFLKALTMPLFEIVIYTHENGFSAAEVVEGIDPDGFIMYKLFRDATKYMNGTHVKDLSKLNRDITKVILLDCDKKTSVLQPRNSLVLKKWEGDPKDISLLELIPFFHAIAMSNVEDVRPVLDFYRDEDDVVAAFRRNQDLLRKQQEEIQQQMQQQRSGGFFGGFFGKK